MRGYYENKKSELQTAWHTARLVTIGYHTPKKFPELDKLFKKEERQTKEDKAGNKAFFEEISNRRRKIKK